MTGHPYLIRIEYWNPMTVSWEIGHAGISLLNPERYVQKLAARGIVARAVDKENEKVVHGEGGDLL